MCFSTSIVNPQWEESSRGVSETLYVLIKIKNLSFSFYVTYSDKLWSYIYYCCRQQSVIVSRQNSESLADLSMERGLDPWNVTKEIQLLVSC
jgi:hypothetical protein